MPPQRRGTAVLVAAGILAAQVAVGPAAACEAPDCRPATEPAEQAAEERSVLERLADLALTAVAAVDDMLEHAIGQFTRPGQALRSGSNPAPGTAPLEREAQVLPADRSAYLIPGQPTELPGRWCAGTIPLYIDFSQARAVGLDAVQERALWRRAADAWAAASDGAYVIRVLGERSIPAADGSAAVDLEQVPSASIAVTYSGAPSAVPASHASALLVGPTAGYGGLTVTAAGPAPGDSRAESGYVLIDAPDVVEGLGDPQRRLQLYTHELGHALGLAHTQGGDSIMGPEIAVESEGIGSRDRQALRTLASLPCRS